MFDTVTLLITVVDYKMYPSGQINKSFQPEELVQVTLIVLV